MKNKKIVIYCDGGSRNNPGPAASAFVVCDGLGNVIHKKSKYLGIQTNNVAEYTAVLLAINWLAKQFSIFNFQFPIIINLDSQLVERQLNGKYKIKNEKLKKIADDIKLKIKNLNFEIQFRWNYRNSNKLADLLVNRELDKHF